MYFPGVTKHFGLGGAWVALDELQDIDLHVQGAMIPLGKMEAHVGGSLGFC